MLMRIPIVRSSQCFAWLPLALGFAGCSAAAGPLDTEDLEQSDAAQ
jgi:hypothetical protein